MSFLTPQDRALLIESLRPPADYQLHTALGTTYSLDLIALMVAPVGFTFFDVDPNDPAFLQKDPLEILEAIRRHAAQIVLFCEAGRIAVPKHHRPLLAYLEDRIVQARAPAEGRSFHPKLWIIRFTNPGGEVWYRLLCLSRNLTFDRSWDTVFTLDGPLRSDRAVGYGANAGLREFVAALPGMAISEVSAGVRDQVGLIENEIGRVQWDMDSTPFEFVQFWPLGHDARNRWPFKGRIQRIAVVSPFVSERVLTKLSDGTQGSVVISRPESLDRIPETALGGFADRLQLATQVSTAEPEDGDVSPASSTPMQGLHAKIYIADDGWDARLWTGSANATASAFGGNVEFMVELRGKKSAIGVSAFLDKVKGTASFSDLLEPYARVEAVAGNAALEALQLELDKLRMLIAAADWTVAVSPGATAQDFVPVASTRAPLPIWGKNVSVSCRLLSIGESLAQPLAPETMARAAFSAMALESLTAFLVFDVQGENEGEKATMQFVVNAKLVGVPPNRRDRILQHMLHDRRALVRFLLLLLADVSDDPIGAAAIQSKSWGAISNAGEPSEALLEPLLRTLAGNPARLSAIASLLKDLCSTEEGAKLLPDGLPALFDAIWAAREENAP